MTNFLLLIYKILSIIFIPIVIIIVFLRILQGKEINSRIKERFAFSKIKRPTGKLIWINASSIGEYLATISLIKKIRKIKPKTKILITTNTKTSALLAKKISDKNIIHQFTPQDNPLVIKKFLNYWKPSLVLWMESEFWPIILDETKKYGVKLILLNGRMSDKSFKNWNLFNFFFKEIISNFSLILTMSKIDKKNFLIKDVLEKPSIVVGGGAPEAELSSQLRVYSNKLNGREQLAVQKFAEALEAIPLTLAENAGLDPIDSQVMLRAAHGQKNKWHGINVIKSKVADCEKLGIFEPSAVKEQILKSSTETACMILRIDDVVASSKQPAPPPGGDMGGMGGMPPGMGGMPGMM